MIRNWSEDPSHCEEKTVPYLSKVFDTFLEWCWSEKQQGPSKALRDDYALEFSTEALLKDREFIWSTLRAMAPHKLAQAFQGYYEAIYKRGVPEYEALRREWDAQHPSDPANSKDGSFVNSFYNRVLSIFM